MPTLTTRLKIAAWDEAPTDEFPDGSKISKAVVTLSDGAEGLTSGTFQSLLYYLADGASSFVTLMRLTGTLDGRTGSFVLTGHGRYDGTAATVTSQILPGSGTEGLAGISGTCTSTSTHADYPFMPLALTYQLA